MPSSNSKSGSARLASRRTSRRSAQQAPPPDGHAPASVLRLRISAAGDLCGEGERRLRRQNAVLVNLARALRRHRADLTAALRTATEAAATGLEVDRVGVWLFDGDRSRIQCADLYQQTLGLHTNGLAMCALKYPVYFRHLRRAFTIAAHHARTDSRTCEFTEDYLGPLGITSMLDAPVRLGGRVIGALCCEHVGPPRTWTLDEQNFVRSVSDGVSLAMEEAERDKMVASREAMEARFDSFMRHTSMVAWMKDEALGYAYVNRAFERLAGRKAADIAGRNDFDLWPRATALHLRANDQTVLRTGRRLELVEVVPGRDGVPRRWRVCKFLFLDPAGRRFVGGTAIELKARHGEPAGRT